MRSFKFVVLGNPAKRRPVPKGFQQTHPQAATGVVTPGNFRWIPPVGPQGFEPWTKGL
jgi:hypothetical protein